MQTVSRSSVSLASFASAAMSILRGEVAAPPEASKLQEALSGY
jgi:hypothetical protein